MTTKMKVRKLLVTDIRCRECFAPPGERCISLAVDPAFAESIIVHNGTHGSRLAEHAELERAGWQWQEVDPRDDGAGRKERTEARGGK